MNDFAKFFLNEDWKGMPDAPRFYLSGFGKHPGWNDHLDDIGLVTISLIEARRLVYEGIAHQIESAAWEKAGREKAAPGFDHILHWRRLHESLTGLMWSSRDGKGRSLYPMITLGHCVGQPFGWQASEVLPALEKVGARCREVSSASLVVAILNETQQSLRAALADQAGVSPAGPGIGVATWIAWCLREPESLQRVVHYLRGNLMMFAPGAQEWGKTERQHEHGISRSLRLPQIPEAGPAESLNAWLTFLATQLDPAVPLLGLVPHGQKWLDVIVGEPAPADFFVLRSLPTGTPIVTEIPYQLDPEIVADRAAIFASLKQGRMPGTSALNGKTVELNRAAAAKWLARFRPSARLGFFGRIFRTSASPF